MGSELFQTLKDQKRKIGRGGAETLVGPPEEFIVIGVDVDADALCKKYPNPDTSKAHARAQAIIRGVVDRTRTKGPPPDWFVQSLAGGVRQFPTVANLGPDSKGRIWIVHVVGRQRNTGLRIWNKKHPDDTHDLTCVLAPLKHNDKAGIDAELDALEANAESNVFVAMAPSSLGDHAARLKAKGKSDAYIAGRIGARDAEHVRQLVALSECCEAVQQEVDAGRVALAACVALSKLAPEEQERRVKRTAAASANGGGRAQAARDAVAPPRRRSVNAKVLEGTEQKARALYKESKSVRLLDAAQILAWALGKAECPEWLANAVPTKGAVK
jgi:hypothetical protein